MKGVLIFGLTVIWILAVLTPVFAEAVAIDYELDDQPVTFNLDQGFEQENAGGNVYPIIQSRNLPETYVGNDHDWVPFINRWRPSDWNQDNSLLQKAITIFIIADWIQTRNIVEDPALEEANPILGANPSLEEVDRYFAICLIGNTLISYLLPQNLRTRWQVLSLRFQIETVNHNFNMGVKFSL